MQWLPLCVLCFVFHFLMCFRVWVELTNYHDSYTKTVIGFEFSTSSQNAHTDVLFSQNMSKVCGSNSDSEKENGNLDKVVVTMASLEVELWYFYLKLKIVRGILKSHFCNPSGLVHPFYYMQCMHACVRPKISTLSFGVLPSVSPRLKSS